VRTAIQHVVDDPDPDVREADLESVGERHQHPHLGFIQRLVRRVQGIAQVSIGLRYPRQQLVLYAFSDGKDHRQRWTPAWAAKSLVVGTHGPLSSADEQVSTALRGCQRPESEVWNVSDYDRG